MARGEIVEYTFLVQHYWNKKYRKTMMKHMFFNRKLNKWIFISRDRFQKAVKNAKNVQVYDNHKKKRKIYVMLFELKPNKPKEVRRSYKNLIKNGYNFSMN